MHNTCVLNSLLDIQQSNLLLRIVIQMSLQQGRVNSQLNGQVILTAPVTQKIRRILLRWGKSNYKQFPWRQPTKRWYGLIAEILLQRTRAANALDVYEQFIAKFPETSDLARASIEEIEKVIYPLGLRWRAPLLKRLGEELDKLGGEPPESLEQLIKLPGVGPYAAAAWLGFHGGKRAVIVDANVVRWLCRMVDQRCNAETRRKKWMVQLAGSLTPERRWDEYNYAVLDFTMEICTTRPRCSVCPIGPELCIYGRKVLANTMTG